MVFFPQRHRAHAGAPGCREVAAMTLLAVEQLGKAFGGVHAIEDLSLRRRARHGALDHRPQRRRQDHAAEHADRHLRARQRPHPPERRGRRPAAPTHALRRRRHRPHLPEPAGLLQHERARERDDRAPPARAPLAAGRRCCARRRWCAPKPRCRDVARSNCCSRVGLADYLDAAGRRHALWRAQAPGDRARAGRRADACCCSTNPPPA